jgi:gas vesicle protein GvpL/GvpF
MTLRYVYGIVPARGAAALETADVIGLEGQRVRALVEGPLVAAESDVAPSEYGEDALNDRIRDLDWLTPRAARHQAVNERLLELADSVIPLSFGTLYRDDQRVREMLREDAAARAARLADLVGKAEWVVTVVRGAERPSGADAELRELDQQIASSAPGRAFLLEKRRATVAVAAMRRADAEVARRAVAALEPVSERTYRETVAQGGPDVVVFRASLLAPRDGARAVESAIVALQDTIAPEGYRVRATGPWPAYRFGSLP